MRIPYIKTRNYTSIFIASITINVSPSSTLCPGSTNTWGRQNNMKRITAYLQVCSMLLLQDLPRFGKPLFNLKFEGGLERHLLTFGEMLNIRWIFPKTFWLFFQKESAFHEKVVTIYWVSWSCPTLQQMLTLRGVYRDVPTPPWSTRGYSDCSLKYPRRNRLLL